MQSLDLSWGHEDEAVCNVPIITECLHSHILIVVLKI